MPDIPVKPTTVTSADIADLRGDLLHGTERVAPAEPRHDHVDDHQVDALPLSTVQLDAGVAVCSLQRLWPCIEDTFAGHRVTLGRGKLMAPHSHSQTHRLTEVLWRLRLSRASKPATYHLTYP
ncbi:MAG: hypothetical protein A3K18_34440 [Lentisphaerae bacterium RIFOXYA12_64_32]|nr:MAG: hypothetical protein A3K18_34440 [Lentisphaerae bacterium RIFOXYA12_64_32]